MTRFTVEFPGSRENEVVRAETYDIHESGALLFYAESSEVTLAELGQPTAAYNDWQSVSVLAEH